ncbi:MAG: hypothetical protein ACKVG0_08555 [Alphaproteobacteria bacterium]
MISNTPRLANLSIAFVATMFVPLLVPSAADAQEVMARGYYNDIESRISAYMPGVTSVDEVSLEQFTYGPMEDGHLIETAYRASHTTEDGTRYGVTSVNFATPEVEALGVRYGFDGTMIKSAMAHAATNYREMGEVTYDQATVVEFIPAHHQRPRRAHASRGYFCLRSASSIPNILERTPTTLFGAYAIRAPDRLCILANWLRPSPGALVSSKKICPLAAKRCRRNKFFNLPRNALRSRIGLRQ